jgi:hypothetical protein
LESNSTGLNLPSPSLSPKKQWALAQVVFAEALRELEKEFSSLSIRFMPVKGAYLITAGLAGRMAQRKMLDIDLLVLPEDFHKVANHFNHHPKATPKQNYWPFEMSFFYELGKARIFVEIHHQLNYPERFLLPAADMFSRSTPGKGCMVFPCPEDALLVLVCHALVHISVEIRDTMFEEISLLAGQEGFSWERFWRLAGNTGIRNFIRLLLWRYADETGIKINLPKVSLYSRLIKPLFREGIFERMPVIVRKVLFEVPYIRNPAGLAVKKITGLIAGR